jgi:hypothetical protein
MRALPSTKDEWIALTVFPFKAYVLMGLPLFRIIAFIFGSVEPWFGFSNVSLAIVIGFHVSVVALLLGFLVQMVFSTAARALHTLCFFAVGLWFDWIAMSLGTIR